MKNLFLAILLIIFNYTGFSQSKKDLQEQIKILTAEKSVLQDERVKLCEQILELKQQVLDLKTENLECKNANEKLQSRLSSAPESINAVGLTSSQTNDNLTTSKRCKAITAKGTQCTRNAEPGSNYCWQHKGTYEPRSTATSSSSSSRVSSGTNSGSSSYGGRTIMTGPRGGRYYINKNGNKTYIKK